jgi:hypothetical protein
VKIAVEWEPDYTVDKFVRAPKSRFGKYVFDGAPNVFDPMGIVKGKIYYYWNRYLGVTIQLRFMSVLIREKDRWSDVLL